MHLITQRQPLPSATLGFIPEGVPGIAQTLRIMTQIVRDSKKTMPVRMKAVELVSVLPPKQWMAEVIACHAYVRDEIRYTQDITDVETVQTPDITMQVCAGDCDDKSVLLCALLESIGHPTRFVACGFTEPGIYEHVYCESKVGDRWIACETTEPVDVGWRPPDMVCRMEHYN